jgi:hypothetical protein
MCAREMPVAIRRGAFARGRLVLDAFEHLVGGPGTALLCLVGVGVPVAPGVLGMVRLVADRERARLSRRGLAAVIMPGLDRAQAWLGRGCCRPRWMRMRWNCGGLSGRCMMGRRIGAACGGA